MRLIDADKLKDELMKHFDAYFNDKGQLMYSDHICTSDDVSDLFNLINKQPTAYDVNNVIAKLEAERELSYADFNKYVEEVSPCLDAEYDDSFQRGLERAIKIAKRGGKHKHETD